MKINKTRVSRPLSKDVTGSTVFESLTQRIETLFQTLASDTDALHASEAIQRVFDFYAQFHRYSLQNTLLIAMHCPHATHVAGFRAWQKMGRWVKRGEHGIPILVPLYPKPERHCSRAGAGCKARRSRR